MRPSHSGPPPEVAEQIRALGAHIGPQQLKLQRMLRCIADAELLAPPLDPGDSDASFKRPENVSIPKSRM